MATRKVLHAQREFVRAADLLLSRQSLGAVIGMFLLDRQAKRCSPHTLRFYGNYLQAFAKYCEAQAAPEVQQVDAALLRNYMLFLAAHGYNPGGQHAAFRSLRALFRWVEREDLLPPDWRNPVRTVDAPKVPQRILEPIPLEDVDRLQRTCEGTGFLDRRDRALLFFLLDTGVRARELCHLDLEDVDLATGEVQVREGKGGKDRRVYLGPTGLRALHRYLRRRADGRSPALFVNREKERLSYEGVRQLIERRCKRAGLARTYSPHDFRRAFAIHMLRRGVDLYTLARLMGHSDITVLKRYLALTTQDLEAAHRRGSPVENFRWT